MQLFGHIHALLNGLAVYKFILHVVCKKAIDWVSRILMVCHTFFPLGAVVYGNVPNDWPPLWEGNSNKQAGNFFIASSSMIRFEGRFWRSGRVHLQVHQVLQATAASPLGEGATIVGALGLRGLDKYGSY